MMTFHSMSNLIVLYISRQSNAPGKRTCLVLTDRHPVYVIAFGIYSSNRERIKLISCVSHAMR
jgi:hypothetical protein